MFANILVIEQSIKHILLCPISSILPNIYYFVMMRTDAFGIPNMYLIPIIPTGWQLLKHSLSNSSQVKLESVSGYLN